MYIDLKIKMLFFLPPYVIGVFCLNDVSDLRMCGKGKL